MAQSTHGVQEIPARYGAATYVPRGQVIKIINTHGTQVVDTWAVALPDPPTQGQSETPRTWARYFSYGSRGKPEKVATGSGDEASWASFFPPGKGFSNHQPQKESESLSAFASSLNPDSATSFSDELYAFSKTPVGGGSPSASKSTPPMEYMSMSHTHASTNRLIPKVGDTLTTNLRLPILTVIEDTAAVHDTVISACDPQRYRELGVEKWEGHGSCSENLVLALKAINESAGLKGPVAVGADITVNTALAPFNLFMNVPFKEEGSLSFGPPLGKEGEFIRMRAERDVVVIMSACPQDALPINGERPVGAHFVVEPPE